MDEHGAEFEFEPSPEDQPRAAIWRKGDEINFRRLALSSGFDWKGRRASSGRDDAGFFRIKTD
jgi:hypothetical protein